MANAENATVETLHVYYADVLSPLKDTLANVHIKFVEKIGQGMITFIQCTPPF